MIKKYGRNILVAALITLGIIIAYCGLLIPGLMVGMLAILVTLIDEFKVLGEEEETDAEEL